MTEIIESNKLIEIVIEKHKRLLDTFNLEFSEINKKLDEFKQESERLKKEKEGTENKIMVHSEMYHLRFHEAKNEREKIFGDIKLGGSAHHISELENKLQILNSVEEEEKVVSEIKQLILKVAKKENMTGVFDKLDSGISLHKELMVLNNMPKHLTESAKESEKQIVEVEKRYNWLKHRIESHENALSYWTSQQKGGINHE